MTEQSAATAPVPTETNAIDPAAGADRPAIRELLAMETRLTYADCDPAGIIYFATWFPWMERIQSEWMVRNDLRQDTLLQRFGFKTITRATECEYLAQAALFDRIEVSYGIARMGRSSVRGEVRMTRIDDGVQVARGSITVVILDADNTPIEVPEPMRSLVLAALRDR
ncbi:acyl-CoA thioesterase [Nakamurella lactea]|uniref:acyl-CoA thioesterase n=1 Tax=Nakamurella lactea TaxID=459515 RepID=UPI0004277509|nr:acyl-CoA thioesterase [Nakamurella lactea]